MFFCFWLANRIIFHYMIKFSKHDAIFMTYDTEIVKQETFFLYPDICGINLSQMNDLN